MPAVCQTTGTVPTSELVQRAEGGDAQSQFELGRVYEDGKEVQQDDGRAAEWFAPTGWPGPTTAAAAEVQASNVLTDAPAKVIVDKWSVDQAIEWEDKKIKEIYDTLRG